MINTNEIKPGDYICYIKNNDHVVIKSVYVAECLDYIICSSKYSDAKCFKEQLKIMSDASSMNETVDVVLINKEYCFKTFEEADKELKKIKMKNKKIWTNDEVIKELSNRISDYREELSKRWLSSAVVDEFKREIGFNEFIFNALTQKENKID